MSLPLPRGTEQFTDAPRIKRPHHRLRPTIPSSISNIPPFLILLQPNKKTARPRMSFQILSERLTTLQESNAQLKDLIDRLANLKFQHGSIPLDDEAGNVLTELSSEIQQTIKDQDEDFELLQEEVYDLDGGNPGTELEAQRSGLEEAVKRAMRALKSYASCHRLEPEYPKLTEYRYEAAFRKAQLAARRNLQAAQKQERELLLQSYIEPRSSTASPLPDQQQRQQHRTHKNKVLTQEEKELNASSDFTLALRRTHESMAAELSRSQFAHDTLKESTAALESLSETYSTLDTMLSRSKNLLGTLMTSQKSDTWYLQSALFTLCFAFGWLVFRRILYGPTWWLLWFPAKMFVKGWLGVYVTMRGSLGSSVEVKSVVSSVTVASSLAASSVVHRKATRGPKIPGLKAPSINVGGGGRGAPMQGPNVPGAVGPESVSDQVGRIIDESNNGKAVTDESAHDATEEGELANPKRRMWEEENEAMKVEARSKDEL